MKKRPFKIELRRKNEKRIYYPVRFPRPEIWVDHIAESNPLEGRGPIFSIQDLEHLQRSFSIGYRHDRHQDFIRPDGIMIAPVVNHLHSYEHRMMPGMYFKSHIPFILNDEIVKEYSTMLLTPTERKKLIDDLDDDEPEFDTCGDCDQPDACSDFGCAIKQGLRERNQY